VYEGFLSFGGTEIINATRTAKYVRNLLSSFRLRDVSSNPYIEDILGEQYDGPVQDDAPWVDASNPATFDFLGLYPLSVEGIDDSTATANITESLGAGGYSDIPRDASRDIRVRALAIGKNPLALSAGLAWLDAALNPPPCQDHGGSCTGATLCYYAAPPQLPVCYEEVGATETTTLVRLSNARGLVQLAAPSPFDDVSVQGTITPKGNDGFSFAYGVSGYTGNPDDYRRFPVFVGPTITPQRTNNVVNPRFAESTYGYTITGGTLSHSPTGGPANGSMGYVEAEGTDGELDITLSFDVSESPSGTNMLSFAARVHSATNGSLTVSVIANNDGSVLATQDFTLTDSWGFYVMTVPYATGAHVEIHSAWQFEITNLVSEGGDTFNGFFDGNSTPPDGYAVSWLGFPNQSRSRMVYTQPITYQSCGANMYAWILPTAGVGDVTVTAEVSGRVPASKLAEPYERYLHDVVRTSGPTVTSRYRAPLDSVAIIEFTMVAGTPYKFGTSNDLLYLLSLDELQKHASWTDGTPPDDPASIITDPDCPPIPEPPRPPVIVNNCVANPSQWDRYYYAIPAEDVSAWSKTLPTITLVSGGTEVRQVRVRFTPNPFGWAPASVDQFAYCAEFILSYLPARTELVVDGTVKRAWASVAGARSVTASNLLYGTDSGPMSWPELTCGVPYLMTIDVPVGTGDDVSLSLSLTRQE